MLCKYYFVKENIKKKHIKLIYEQTALDEESKINLYYSL